MRKTSIDTSLRVRILHQPGQLARLARIVADHGALIGDISTHRIQEESTVRDITIETFDETQLPAVLAAIKADEGIELISATDRVFECHRGGKIHSTTTVELNNEADMRYIYTPGVARVSQALVKDPNLAYEFTAISNSVGIFTNGTRVLGLGDIGPLASLPVMEGKAVLYDKFAHISATPLLVDTKDPELFIETVVLLSKSFGGIHLEDIRVPDCFRIEDELKRRLNRPVMHDDQHGTATVALAAIINACKLTKKELSQAHVGQIGLGAAGSAIARLVLAYGVKDVVVSDVSPHAVAELVKDGARAADLATLMRECDIVVATTGKPGLISADMVRPGQVIFSLSNPFPEIEPYQAIAAGAAFASDGRSINNALAFPGLFKGALQERSRSITREMMLAAAQAIADLAETGDVVPSPLNPAVHLAVCAAVAAKARQQGLSGTARPD